MSGPVTRIIALLALLFQFLWPRYLFFQFGGKGISGFTLVAAALLVSAIMSLFIRHRLRSKVGVGVARSKLQVGLFVALWLWRFLCDVTVGGGGQAAFGTFLDLLYLGSWFISGVIIFADDRIRGYVPYAMLVAVLVATLFGLVEYQTGVPLARMLGFGNLSLDAASFTQDLSRGGANRVRSLFSHPIVYGQMIGGLAPFALFLLFSRRLGDKFLGALMALAIGVSLVLCNARSPLVVTAVAIVCFMAFYLFDLRRKLRLFLAMLGLMVAVAAMPIGLNMLDQVLSGRSAEEASSTTARTIQIDRGTTALRGSPIMGFGFGSAGEYAATRAGDGTRVSVDNYYLTVAVESGYVGLALFLALLMAMCLQGLRAIYSATLDRARSLNCAALGTIAGLASGLTVVSISDSLSVIFQMGGFLIAATGASVIARRERAATQRAASPDAVPLPA